MSTDTKTTSNGKPVVSAMDLIRRITADEPQGNENLRRILTAAQAGERAATVAAYNAGRYAHRYILWYSGRVTGCEKKGEREGAVKIIRGELAKRSIQTDPSRFVAIHQSVRMLSALCADAMGWVTVPLANLQELTTLAVRDSSKEEWSLVPHVDDLLKDLFVRICDKARTRLTREVIVDEVIRIRQQSARTAADLAKSRQMEIEASARKETDQAKRAELAGAAREEAHKAAKATVETLVLEAKELKADDTAGAEAKYAEACQVAKDGHLKTPARPYSLPKEQAQAAAATQVAGPATARGAADGFQRSAVEFAKGAGAEALGQLMALLLKHAKKPEPALKAFVGCVTWTDDLGAALVNGLGDCVTAAALDEFANLFRDEAEIRRDEAAPEVAAPGLDGVTNAELAAADREVEAAGKGLTAAEAMTAYDRVVKQPA